MSSTIESLPFCCDCLQYLYGSTELRNRRIEFPRLNISYCYFPIRPVTDNLAGVLNPAYHCVLLGHHLAILSISNNIYINRPA